MESIKKLKEAAEECLKEFKLLDSKANSHKNAILQLEANKDTLSKELVELGEKKDAVQKKIGTMEKEAKDEIDTRKRELRRKEEELTAERAEVKKLQFQAESARADAEQEKTKYAQLYAEYSVKLAALEEKRQAILAAAK